MKKIFKDIIAFVVGIPFGVIAFAAMIVSVLCMLTVKVSCVMVGYLGAAFKKLRKEERDEDIATLEDLYHDLYESFNDNIFDV